VFLPDSLLTSLKGLPGFDADAFAAVHESGEQVTSIRINPARQSFPEFDTEITPVPWTTTGYYLHSRPSFTFDPRFHAGAYYVQEASSMLIEQAFRQHAEGNTALKALDLCAAPGGKSTHLQSLISGDSLLVSNEVIRSRASVLRDNIIKWGAANVVVTNNDPADFQRVPDFFDLLLIDAPCSGSGLFRRDPEAVGEWSLDQVQFCAARQKRILLDALPSLKEGGLLFYSTCSYSKEEDEEILQFIQQQGEMENLPLQLSDDWHIVESIEQGVRGYRCWPQLMKGEGFFLAIFRKKYSSGQRIDRTRKNLTSLSRQEQTLVADWLPAADQFSLFKNENTVFAWPSHLAESIEQVFDKMQVIYAGLRAGELVRNKMIPDHALAMYTQRKSSIAVTPLDYESAITYLQRKDLSAALFLQKGWQLVAYDKWILGWVNVLSNRVNNYYPKELRILKEK
jgi:16S rRNA C967 or C1407 C5-methylase (RsmB/RsmF family)/NOL1/NOP2/fmu family ribosome biogenesis protein